MLAGAGEARAHARSESYSTWRIDDGTVTGVITIPAAEAARLVPLGNTRPLAEVFLEHAGETIAVAGETADCPLTEANALEAARGFVRAELGYDCGGAAPAELRFRAIFAVAPGHVHYARVFANSTLLAEVLFTDHADTRALAGADAAARTSFGAFLELGIRHIAGGVDHIAFLLGMLLVAASVSRSVVAVTGFTLGHSVSLAAAVLGYLHADGRLVEAFIGFTVALIAVEYFAMRRERAQTLALTAAAAAVLTGVAAWGAGLVASRALYAYAGFAAFAFCYLVASTRLPSGPGRPGNALLFVATACFGLVHGFGFAGFLMETGITGGSLLLPLLGFNLGVEVGQLALLAVAFLVLSVAADRRLVVAAPLAAALLCGVGVYWFVGRSLAA